MSNLTTNVFSLTGNPTETIFSLIASPPEGNSDLSTLSMNNYPSGDKVPNESNQHVFMNQPLSWWLEELNSGTIQYTPVSSNVNWSYVNASGSTFHIARTVTNIIIPNKTQSVERDSKTNTTTIVLRPPLWPGTILLGCPSLDPIGLGGTLPRLVANAQCPMTGPPTPLVQCRCPMPDRRGAWVQCPMSNDAVAAGAVARSPMPIPNSPIWGSPGGGFPLLGDRIFEIW